MTLQEQIRANRRRSALVVVLFLVLVVVVAAASYVFVGEVGAVGIIAFGLAYALFAWWNGGRMVGSLTHAAPLEKKDDPELYRLVENVAIAAGLPATPPVYMVEDPAPNAFAAGVRPDSVYVGVTRGLRQLMPDRELEAVLAHEISHIRNRDVRLMTLAAVLVGVVAMISDFAFRMAFFGGRSRERNPLMLLSALVALILAPLAAVLLQMALSRRREYLADAFFADFLAGTLSPSRRASESAIAMACLRLFTFLPEPPLRSLPALRSCITFLTFACVFLPYFAMGSSSLVSAPGFLHVVPARSQTHPLRRNNQ